MLTAFEDSVLTIYPVARALQVGYRQPDIPLRLAARGPTLLGGQRVHRRAYPSPPASEDGREYPT